MALALSASPARSSSTPCVAAPSSRSPQLVPSGTPPRLLGSGRASPRQLVSTRRCSLLPLPQPGALRRVPNQPAVRGARALLAVAGES
jgi:hypothetical protein